MNISNKIRYFKVLIVTPFITTPYTISPPRVAFPPIYHPTLSAMLEYAKTILLKVSFDRALFEKELRKAVRTLAPDELLQFKDWCYKQFVKVYQLILNRVFGQPTLA